MVDKDDIQCSIYSPLLRHLIRLFTPRGSGFVDGEYVSGTKRRLRSSSGYNHIQKHDHTHKHEQGHKHSHTQEHIHSHQQNHTHVADHTHEHEHVHKHKHNHIHDVLEEHQHAHSHKGYASRRHNYERMAVDHTRDFLKGYMRGTYSRLTGY